MASAAEINALFQRGFALHREGKLAEADTAYGKVLRRDPRHVDALHLSGLIALQSNRAAEAAALIARAVGISPGVAAMHVNHARALHRGEKPDDAIAAYDRALALDPGLAEAHSSRGDLLYAARRIDEALAGYDRALTLKPDLAAAHIGKGNALKDQGRLDEALAAFETAAGLAPDNFIAHYNRAAILRLLGRLDDAIAAYDRCIALRPDFPVARYNQAGCLLQTGDFPRGLAEYEWRKACPDFDDPRYAGPRQWTGAKDLAGKTLFVYPELYLGDMIQFCRYAALARDRGARVLLAAPAVLHPLLRSLGEGVDLLPKDAQPDGFDYQCALMSLPLAFGTTVETIPAPVPYLHAEPERVGRWRERIGQDGFKIGVCWQGSTLPYALSMQRSFPLAQLSSIARRPGVRLISLQKQDGLDQLADLPAVETLGDFDEGDSAFVDTAAVMASLDLVISADTATAHLAGALGVATFLPLPQVTDWRWLQGRDDSPWYPSLRLFRQGERGGWGEVFARIEAALPL